MAKETERKFLVRGEFKPLAFKKMRITQGYLCSDPERTVRIRMKDDIGYLTVKGKGDETLTSRFEWEKEISSDDARSLLNLCLPGVIDKTRYLIKNADGIHTWEVDEFYGDNAGLVVAEIELQDEDDSFDIPSWIGEEVSSDRRYFNSALSMNPFTKWR